MDRDPPGANREPHGSDFVKGAIAAIAFVIVLTASCIVLTLALGMIGFILWIAIVVPVLLAAILLWHSRATAYRCPECDHEFTIGAWRDLITPHRLDKFRLRCPRCGKVSWMQVLVREKR